MFHGVVLHDPRFCLLALHCLLVWYIQLARVDGIQQQVFGAVGDFQRLSKEVMHNLQYSANAESGVATSRPRLRGQRQNQKVCYPPPLFSYMICEFCHQYVHLYLWFM